MLKLLTIHLVAFLIVMSGCGHKLRPDSSVLSAIQGNYPTAEFEACGKTWHGLGICVVEKGTKLETLKFSVQGYYKGAVKFDSGDCGISAVRTYKDNQKVADVLYGDAVRSCVVTFTVSPIYPKQEQTDIVTSSFRGHLRIKVVEPGTYVKADVFRIPKTFKKSWKVNVGEKGPVEVYFEGCGVSYATKIYADDNNIVDVPIMDLFAGKPRTCILEGLVRSEQYEDLLLTAVVAAHYDEFNPLPTPVTKYVNGYLTVEADESVAVVSVGDKFKEGNINHFKVSKKTIVRVLTMKGRSAVGFFIPETGEVEWILR